MAFPTALCVIGGSKPVLNFFNFLEDKPVIIERAQRYDSVLIDFLKVWPLFSEAVGQVVKARGCFRCVTASIAEGGAILAKFQNLKG